LTHFSVASLRACSAVLVAASVLAQSAAKQLHGFVPESVHVHASPVGRVNRGDGITALSQSDLATGALVAKGHVVDAVREQPASSVVKRRPSGLSVNQLPGWTRKRRISTDGDPDARTDATLCDAEPPDGQPISTTCSALATTNAECTPSASTVVNGTDRSCVAPWGRYQSESPSRSSLDDVMASGGGTVVENEYTPTAFDWLNVTKSVSLDSSQAALEIHAVRSLLRNTLPPSKLVRPALCNVHTPRRCTGSAATTARTLVLSTSKSRQFA